MAKHPLAVAPNMPATSIDFDKLHAAVTKGQTAEEAIAAADLTPPPAPEEPAAPAPDQPVIDDAA